MAAIVFLGIAYCGWIGGHVAVDILERPLENPRLRFVPVILTFVSARAVRGDRLAHRRRGARHHAARQQHDALAALAVPVHRRVRLGDVRHRAAHPVLSGCCASKRRGTSTMSRSDAIGLIGIGVLLLLMALRMPIGIAMLLVGIVGFARAQRLAGGARRARQLSLSIRRGLRLRRHSAVRADGQSRLGVGHGARPLCRRLCLDRPCARRARARHHPRLRRICRGVGIERRLGGDHGQGLPAGDAALQLQPPARHRRDRRRRHARHPDPAEHGVRDLRAAHRAVDRQAAAGRHPAGPAADRASS